MIRSLEFCSSSAVNCNGHYWSNTYKGQKCPLENLRQACPHQTHPPTHSSSSAYPTRSHGGPEPSTPWSSRSLFIHPSSCLHLHFLSCCSDCALEQVVKYGETYNIHLNHVEGPVTVEFRYGQCQRDRNKQDSVVCIQHEVMFITGPLWFRPIRLRYTTQQSLHLWSCTTRQPC